MCINCFSLIEYVHHSGRRQVFFEDEDAFRFYHRLWKVAVVQEDQLRENIFPGIEPAGFLPEFLVVSLYTFNAGCHKIIYAGVIDST